ncbi:MAG: hypothetical protein AAB576_02040, partial [Elusimicrobiota bacterium]
MENSSRSSSPARESPLLSWACAIAAATASLALIGKLLDIQALASGLPSSIPMAPSTACAFLCLAAALHPGLPWRGSLRARLGLLAPVFLIPLPDLAGVAGWYLKSGGDAVTPGLFDPWTRVWIMSPLTAGLFFILGACAAAGVARARGVGSPAAAWGASFAAAFSTVVLIGYIYRVPLFYRGRVIPMAATTAACFLVLSAALLAEAGRGLWPWSLFEGDSPAPRMLRSFLPLFAGFILLMGFLTSRSSVVSSPLAAALILLVSLPCMAWMVARVSAGLGAAIETAERRLGESEALNREAQAALRENELQLQVILEATADGILAVDNQGRTLKTNRRFAELWRVPAEILETHDDQAMLDHVVGQLT